MDTRLEKIFAEKLKISQETLKLAYSQTLKEFTEELPPAAAVQKTVCFYKFALGKNSGKNCGKEAKQEFEDKHYCTTHYKSIKDKKTRSNNLKLKDTGQKNFEVKPSRTFETEKHNEHLVLKGTLLIVDGDHNCCIGKFEKDEFSDKITREEQSKLEDLDIPYQRCTVVDAPDIDVETDMVNSELISV